MADDPVDWRATLLAQIHELKAELARPRDCPVCGCVETPQARTNSAASNEPLTEIDCLHCGALIATPRADGKWQDGDDLPCAECGSICRVITSDDGEVGFSSYACRHGVRDHMRCQACDRRVAQLDARLREAERVLAECSAERVGELESTLGVALAAWRRLDPDAVDMSPGYATCRDMLNGASNSRQPRARVSLLVEAMAALADLPLGDHCVLEPNMTRWVNAMHALGYDNKRDDDIDKMHAEVATVLVESTRVIADYGRTIMELRAEQRAAGDPWAWAVVDATSTIPCDEGGTCDYLIAYSEAEATEAAQHHRHRLWDEGPYATEAECDAAVTVVPLYPRPQTVGPDPATVATTCNVVVSRQLVDGRIVSHPVDARGAAHVIGLQTVGTGPAAKVALTTCNVVVSRQLVDGRIVTNRCFKTVDTRGEHSGGHTAVTEYPFDRFPLLGEER